MISNIKARNQPLFLVVEEKRPVRGLKCGCIFDGRSGLRRSGDIWKSLSGEAPFLSLLSREFVLYIALSSLIAFPIAYYAINQWLQTFPYRIELGLVTFLLGSLVMFIVVVTTVATQVLKAIRANPVEALRYE